MRLRRFCTVIKVSVLASLLVGLGVEEDLLSHSYHLRPGLEVELQLPTDLTKDEAKRLASFLESLPFE